MRTIKFKGRNMNGGYEYGLLTKKKIRSSGKSVWAIAKGNCTAGETVPVDEDSIAQFVGISKDGLEVYEGDVICNVGINFRADMSCIFDVGKCKFVARGDTYEDD